MKTENVKLKGLTGTWYLIDEYHDTCTYYLFESEQHGEDWPAVLTDGNLTVIDDQCLEGLDQALIDNGLA